VMRRRTGFDADQTGHLNRPGFVGNCNQTTTVGR
jgi:hypothetical protein